VGISRTPYGTFTARWTDPYGRRSSRTFKTMADARAHLRKTYGDMARGEYVDSRRARVTLADWADDWLAGARNLSRGGYDTYRRDLDRHILPKLGTVSVGRLGSTDIDRYLTERLSRLSASTVHRHYRTLHRMLAVAVERGLIPRNPCEHVHPPRIPRAEMAVLDAGQVDALAAAISPRYRAWVYVMAYGGLRWAESVGLRRRHVETRESPPPFDLADKALTGVTKPVSHRQSGGHPGGDTPQHTARLAVVEQLVHRGRGEWERCEPKSGSRRTVTLPGFVAVELAEHLERYSLPDYNEAPNPDTEAVSRSGGNLITGAVDASGALGSQPQASSPGGICRFPGLVFPTRNGTPIQAPSFRQNTFRRALDKAGLPPIRVHDLRHTAISLAIEAGANPKLSQARAGHSSIGIHLDRYGHLFPGADETVAQALDELHAKAQRGRLRAV